MMQTIVTIEELRNFRTAVGTQSLGFVPTMGALHAGHISLTKLSQMHNQKTIVSIFVNPRQFGRNEDYSKYPRTLDTDIILLEKAGVDAVYLPSTNDIYPEGFQTYVVNDYRSSDLCGKSRPDHFRGVLTVVLKLLHQVTPSTAFFGKKDFQQWHLIDQMVRDFDLPIKITGAPIVREENGLAMSSRNQYLKQDERKNAGLIFEALTKAKKLFDEGERGTEPMIKKFTNSIAKEPQFALEYAEIRDAKSLAPFDRTISAPAVFLVALRYGGVRLIDNLELTAKT